MTDRDVVYPRGPGHHGGRGPVLDVYAETRALEIPCTACHAAIDSFCSWPSGELRKVPCGVRRPKAEAS